VHPTTSVISQQKEESNYKRADELGWQAERLLLEEQLRDFDAMAFYDELEQWCEAPIPQPISQKIRTSPFKMEETLKYPLPLSRGALYTVRQLSTKCTRVLYLLRAIDRYGIECPFIYQHNKRLVEQSLAKCETLLQARSLYLRGSGLWTRLHQCLNVVHIFAIRRDLEAFRKKLEAIALLSRHYEFAQDLVRLRQLVSISHTLEEKSSVEQRRKHP
jgi:hypothetical protein